MSVITNISLDHEQYLGTTVGEIAAEKAGIIKPNVPVVTGARQGEALTVIEARAACLRAPVFLLNRDFKWQAARARTRDCGAMPGSEENREPAPWN